MKSWTLTILITSYENEVAVSGFAFPSRVQYCFSVGSWGEGLGTSIMGFLSQGGHGVDSVVGSAIFLPLLPYRMAMWLEVAPVGLSQ